MSLKSFTCCLATALLCTLGLLAQTLQPHTLAYAPGKSITLSLPAKLDIHVAASGLRRVRFLAQAPWMAFWPGFAIFIAVLSFNLLGDGLRDAGDARS